MSVNEDYLNALDRSFFLGWHVRRKKHRSHMGLAEMNIRASRLMRDQFDDPITGYDYLRKAINEVVECGCPSEVWPSGIKEAIDP